MLRKTILAGAVFLVLLFTPGIDGAQGWHDETHLAVAKAAGYGKWYNAAGADIAKIKAGATEGQNHFFDNPADTPVTPEHVMEQTGRYNDPGDADGHLYGAVIGSLKEYVKSTRAGKYAEYHLAFCAHYIGDLSHPLHNTRNDDFNKARHVTNDGIVEKEVLKKIPRIRKKMDAVHLRQDNFEQDLAAEVARIAEGARELGRRMRDENRDMTKQEAYRQLARSASLLRAVIRTVGKVR